MVIKSKLTEKDFVNLNLTLLYSKLWMRLLTVIAIIGFLVTIVSLFFKSYPPFSSIAVLTIILIFLPISTYFTAKKNYLSNKRISESIEYRFTENYLEIIGESFSSQYTWDKIYKVTKVKNWILIWHNRQVANPVPKRDVWEGKLADLKRMLEKHKVKNNL